MASASSFQNFIRSRRLKIVLGSLIALVALFGLLGYFWLPGYLKTQLETLLSDAVRRPVTVQSIEIQPYTLELTVRGFRIAEKASDEDADKFLLSIDELYTDLSSASLTHRAPVISALSVKGPAIRIVREGEQRFNITDLLEDFMNRPDDGGKSLFSVSNITIEGGHFEFVDRVKNSRQEISDIRIGVPFVANFENYETTWVEPHFSARINGSPLALNGKVRPFTTKREASLELKLSGIDLTRIDEYSPIPVDIHLLSGYFDSDLALIFSQAEGESPSMVLTGTATLRGIGIENQAVQTPYVGKLDRLDVNLVELNLNGQTPSRAGLSLTDASMTRKNDDDAEPVLSLQRLGIENTTVDPAEQGVVIGMITLDGFRASMRREADGSIDLVRLFSPLPGSTATPEQPLPVPEKAVAEKPWTIRVETAKLVAAALRYEDSTLTRVAPLVVEPLDLTVSNIDATGATPLELALRASVNQKGSLETSGSLAWAPLATDLAIDARDIDLVALQGWAGKQLNALLTRGSASFKGQVKANGTPLQVAVDGTGRFANFNVLDKTTATDLVRWRSLDIDGLKFINAPLRVDVSSVSIADFFAYAILSPEGKLSLQNIVATDDEPGRGEKPVPPAAPPDPAKPLPVRIGRIVMQGGNVIFHDQFIRPNYRANLTGLAGRVGPLDPKKRGEIDIRGTVDRTAPLKIAGKIDPLGSELYLDIAATAKGIDMPTFSPYSGKYVGYAIEKGKLSVDIHYHIEKGELKAENNVFLDQLTLGEKVESPDALSVPINLALALLKNRHGEIDVHLPISGSINDPQFSIGGLILKVIVNLLTKAATAPFALLGSLLGDDEELSAIEYSAGLAQVTPEAEKRLDALSKALTDRPALKLEITGRIDPEHDPEALKRAMLARKVKAQKLSEEVKKGKAGGTLDEVEVKPEEYEKYLTLAYKEEKFAKPKNMVGLTKSLPVPEMEQLILANIDAGDSEMRDLAERRAVAARDWLVEQGGISGDRVFVLAGKTRDDTETEQGDRKSGSRAEFSLR